MNEKIREITIKSKLEKLNSMNSMTNKTHNTIDVSFSIPDWKQQQINSLNEQYQKQIYTAVPLSLTDFDSNQEVQFLSKPEKCFDEKFAYQRKLVNSQDFPILAFILCLEQTLIGDQNNKEDKLQKFKKKLNELDLCVLNNIPPKMIKYYDNRVLKKILFQYINKGSYNVSLLQILLRRNLILKFALSLVSRSILKNRRIIQNYNQKIPYYIQMRNCGDQLGVLQTIKVREKYIQTQHFFVEVGNEIKMRRKQNIIEIKDKSQIKQQIKRSKSSQLRLCSSRQKSRNNMKQQNNLKQQNNQLLSKDKYSKKGKMVKRSNSVVNFFRRIFCF